MRCDECGFDWDTPPVDVVGAAIEEASTAFAAALTGVDRPAERRRTGVWSPLEYACHMRDVLIVQRERVLLAQWEDTPAVTPMGRDVRVELDGYRDQDPTDVLDEIAAGTRRLLRVLTLLDQAGWTRTVLYNYPEPAVRSVAWVARGALHELRHHTHDITRQA